MFIQNIFLFPDTAAVGRGHMLRVSMALEIGILSLVFCDCAHLPWQDYEGLFLFLKSS